MKKQTALATLLALASTTAIAHPGHGLETGFASGFLHPLTGLDHLLVMVAVGLWAAKLGGKARWQLPVTFIGMMAMGALIGQSTFAQIGLLGTSIESWVAATVIAMGVLLAISLSLPRYVQAGAVGVFAIIHGLAHGAELQHAPMPLLGMLFATAVLHGLGLALGQSSAFNDQRIRHTFALCLMLAGGYWLA